MDQSDVGPLFEHVRTLLEQVDAEVLDESRIGDRTVLQLAVTGAPGVVVAGVHRYELWLDTASQFPVKVISHDQADAIIETVTLDNLEINLALPQALFNPGWCGQEIMLGLSGYVCPSGIRRLIVS